jgi:hypothetical protein
MYPARFRDAIASLNCSLILLRGVLIVGAR